MSKNWVYKASDWNLLCDRCNKRIKASESRKEWTGLQVCNGCFEIRHPQDFVKATTDKISVPFSRPRGTDEFVPVDYVSYPVETVVFDEVVSKDFGMVVPDSLEYSADTVDQSLGRQYLGEMPLASNRRFIGYNSRIGFVESVTTSLGFEVAPTDSIGFSESFTKADDESSGTDTMGFSEVVTPVRYINNALGVQVLGRTSL